MDRLPKLLPLWHDILSQTMIRNSPNYSEDKLPDYNGAGINVTFKNNEMICHTPKSPVDEVHFGAQVCALPFLPPNKASLLIDPCLSPIIAADNDLKIFCMKLDTARKNIATAEYRHFRNKIISLQKNIRRHSMDTKAKFCIPSCVMELANKFTENVKAASFQKVNFGYTGGCLVTSQGIDNQHLLLYPTGPRLNKLAIISLEEACEFNRAFTPLYSNRKVIKLKNSYIHQIKSDYNGYCYVRQEGHCHFVNFTNLHEVSYHECEDQREAINIAASPYNPMELISMYGSGKIELSDIDERKILWSVNKNDYVEPFVYNSLRSSIFGSHPKSVLCLMDKRLYSFDLRSMDEERSTIFTSEHPSLSLDEKFLIIKALGVNPFQHLVASTHHLFVFDERYPNKPILMWNHLLKDPPLYCDLACYNMGLDNSDAVIVLGTQKSHELVSFAVNAQHSGVETLSLSPPLSLSSSTDCTKALELQCIKVDDDIVERLAYPLVGVSVVPHSKKLAFTACHMTSVGDLFYQDFEKGCNSTTERAYKVDMGCALAPANKILPTLTEWINKCNHSLDIDILTPVTDGDTCDFERIYVDLRDIVAAADTKEACISIDNPSGNVAETDNGQKRNSVTESVKKVKRSIRCNECDISFRTIISFRTHLVNYHKKHLRQKELLFSNMRDFEKWKLNTEKKELTFFGLQKQWNTLAGLRSSYYCVCCDFKYTKNLSKMRSIALQGRLQRAKIKCTAGITCLINPYQICVNYFPDHYIYKSETPNEHLSAEEDLLGDPSPTCSVCRLDCNVSDEEVTSNTKCSSCGLYDLQSEKLIKAFNELNLIVGPDVESPEIPAFNTSDLSLYTDPFSKKVLEPWISSASLDEEIRTPEWDYNSDFSLTTMSPASSQSHSNFCSTPAVNMDDSEPFAFSQNMILQSDSHDLSFMNQDNNESWMFSQESNEEFVPPSQEVRSQVGETLRAPKRQKSVLYKTRMSSSGF